MTKLRTRNLYSAARASFYGIFVLATGINSNLNRIDFWLIWHVSSIDNRQQYLTAWQNHPNRKCLWYPAKNGLMSRDQNCFILKHFGDKKKLAILTSKKKQSMAVKYHLNQPLKGNNYALDVQNEAKRLLKRNKTAHVCTVTELSHIYQSWLGKSSFCCLNHNKATKFWC